jgi:methanogenic corrinoid protein MtbC1
MDAQRAFRTADRAAEDRSDAGGAPGEGGAEGRARPADAAPGGAEAGRHHPSIADLIASQVIPRLLLTCRANAVERRPSAAHVETLARLALSREPTAAGAQVDALLDGGLSVETVLNDLIAPAARRLGDYWHADAADFVEVALATQRLLSIVRGLGARVERDHPAAASAPRALIGSPEIERHALGALIVAQTFRAFGWRVREAPGAAGAELARLVARDRYELAGLSAAFDRSVEQLAAAVAELRAASANRAILVAVGGPAIGGDPAMARRIGADFVASDAREAVRTAERLLLREG